MRPFRPSVDFFIVVLLKNKKGVTSIEATPEKCELPLLPHNSQHKRILSFKHQAEIAFLPNPFLMFKKSIAKKPPIKTESHPINVD